MPITRFYLQRVIDQFTATDKTMSALSYSLLALVAISIRQVNIAEGYMLT